MCYAHHTILKPTASIYFCGDWRSSAVIYRVLSAHTIVRNRITWEREKGRGAQHNWKNNSEDIWYATLSDQYTFNVDAVKLKRRVIGYVDGVFLERNTAFEAKSKSVPSRNLPLFGDDE